MNERTFRAALLALAAVGTIAFAVIIAPALAADHWDVWGAALKTFVNPYAAGVSTDVLLAYAVLAVWVFYEAVAKGVRRGWVALLLGLLPGLTTGFAAYLLIRMRQLQESHELS